MSDVNLTRPEKPLLRPNREPNPPFILRETDKQYLVDLPTKLVKILMSVHAGNSYEATATAYNIPIGTVKSRVHRARDHILKARAAAEAGTPSQQLLESADD